MTLTGLTILLIEDEPLIALDVTEILCAAGASVQGPLRSLTDALATINVITDERLWDAVVLDYNLTDGTSEPIAAQLRRKDIPFIVHSGLSEKLKPFAAQLAVPLIAKPASEATLIQAIHDVIK